MKKVLITAAEFAHYGGWGLDTQFIVNMGTPYLLAHGLGNPVADAETEAVFDEDGEYSIKVYTFNWTSPWTKDYAPGKYQILLDGQSLETKFGKVNGSWGWQDGGKVRITAGTHKITLHDLTGFEGRCGLILFTDNDSEILPTAADEVRTYVRQTKGTEEIPLTYDLVICGGGIAGMCAALSAARQGVHTALVQDRMVVGGNNSSEVRVWLGGETNFAPYPGVGNIVNELEQSKVGHYGAENVGENYEDDRKLKLLRAEKNLDLYLGNVMAEVQVDTQEKTKSKAKRIRKIHIWDVRKNTWRWLQAPLFCDSTGDSTLGFLAGADFETTTNGHMGMSNLWYVEKTDREQTFPACPWAVNVGDADFPGRDRAGCASEDERARRLGAWFWEGGCDIDPIDKAEYTRDLNLRAMYGAWDCLKNKDKDFKTWQLGYSSYIGGKRESRRLFGDVVLTKSEVINEKVYPDRCVPSTWNFDVHYPDRRYYGAFGGGDGFIAKDYHEPFHKPYFIPYRCLYSRNISNLFMAGRNVSVSHDALGTVRVMRTGGMMGEVVGMAARLCLKHDAFPRDIYERYLEELTTTLTNIPHKKLHPLVANV